MPSSGIWRPVDLVWTDVSEERIARLSLQPPVHAGSLFAEFSTLKMEAVRSSETSVHTRFTRLHIREDGILHGGLVKYSWLCRELHNAGVYCTFVEAKVVNQPGTCSEDVCGCSIVAFISKLVNRWSWVVSFMLRSLHASGNSPPYALGRRLAGTPDVVDKREEALSSAENEPRFLGRPSRS
jgi:hypothetical protein